MAEAWRARWSALEADEAGQISLYASAPGAVREAILRELCAAQRWAFLGRLVEAAGVWPGHAEALAGTLALGAQSEPLWWLIWQEQVGVSQNGWLTEALLQVMTARGQRVLTTRSRAPGASWLLSDLVPRTAGRHAVPAQAGPFEALWAAEPCWGVDEQLMFAAQRQTALGADELIAVVEAMAGRARGSQMLAWLVEWLAQSEWSWQPVLARVWACAPVSEALCAAISARQRALIAAGRPVAWVDGARAQLLASLRGGELAGLPWSLGRLKPKLEEGKLAPYEYVWLVSAPAGLAGAQAAELAQAVQLVHDHTSGMQLAALLKALPRGTPRGCVPLWLKLGERPESLVRLELARLIARLELREGCAWLEHMLERSSDARLSQELVAALSVVGDARSVAALGHARRHKLLTHDELARLARVVGERPMQPRAALDEGALVSAGRRWEALELAPRHVSDAAAIQLGLQTHPQHNSYTRWTALLLPLVWWGCVCMLRVVGEGWGYETIKAMSWLLLSWQVVLLALTWRVRGIWSMYWSPCDADKRELLAQGEASVGAVFGVDEAKQVAFVDSVGTRRLIELTPTQAAQVAYGEQVNLLYRAGGHDEVLIARGLEVDAAGRLAPQINALELFLELWIVRLLWLSIVPLVVLVALSLAGDVLGLIVGLLGS